MRIVGTIIGVTVLIVVILGVRHATHMSKIPKTNTVSAPTKSPVQADCYSKEYYDLIATDSSKRTVDFIVDKMITDKFIIVNKDGLSYRFKLVKKFKQQVKK